MGCMENVLTVILTFYSRVIPDGGDQKKDPSKASGNSSDIRRTVICPPRFERITSASRQNSHRICLHAPHGGVSRSVSATTATASKPRSPSERALKTATRSAQSVNPKVEFSILQPVKIRPEFARSAAPTRK